MRPIRQEERVVIERLIGLAPSEEREGLRANMIDAMAGESCACGCGTFEIVLPGDETKEQRSLVAEGFVARPGGLPPLSVMLFGSGGDDEGLLGPRLRRPRRLEMYAPERLDGDPRLVLPSPEEIEP